MTAKSLRFCSACEELSKAAKKRNIQVMDVWDTSSLVNINECAVLSGCGFLSKSLDNKDK
jgi:hypothetical protein